MSAFLGFGWRYWALPPAKIRLLILVSPCQTAPDPDRIVPSSCSGVDNILPDADAALTVGMAVIEIRYGTAAFERGKPYMAASFRNDQWCVFHRSDPWIRGGGHPEICLSKKDGRVLSIGRSL
jgi:hypothetical protein